MTRDSENSLGGYRSNEEWDDLMAQVASLISGIESLEDKNTKHQICHLIQQFKQWGFEGKDNRAGLQEGQVQTWPDGRQPTGSTLVWLPFVVS